MLDSLGDGLFFLVCMIRLFPFLELKSWVWIWGGGIAAIRFLSLFVDFLHYHQITCLHTVANKATGFLLFLTPLFLLWFSRTSVWFVLCAVATLSAVEELLLNLFAVALSRDRKSIFFRSKAIDWKN